MTIKKVQKHFSLTTAALSVGVAIVATHPMISVAAPTDEAAQVYASQNVDKKSWAFRLVRKAEDQLMKSIEESVNDWFAGNVWEKFGQSVAEEFGKQILGSFANMISFGPFFNIGELIIGGNQKGPSEVQVMTRILLEAIEDSKLEIIKAVEDSFEENFQTETEVMLNTVIRELTVYNARSFEQRAASFRELRPWITIANTVKERIEIKEDRAFENLHLYMKIAALQVQMELEYTRFSVLDLNPEATEEDIKFEISRVIGAQLSPDIAFLTGSKIGNLDAWRNQFKNEFSNAKSTVTAHAYKQITGVSSVGCDIEYHEKFIALRDRLPTPTYRLVQLADCFTYQLGGRQVLFSAYSGDGRMEVYDAAHRYVGSAQRQFPNGTAGGFERDLRASTLMDRVLERHWSDNETFLAYLRDGYLPAKRMIDTWWTLTGIDRRPTSEVDNYVRLNLQSRADLKVTLEPLPGRGSKAKKVGDLYEISYIASIVNLGDTTARNVVLENLGPHIRHNTSSAVKNSAILDFRAQPDQGSCYIQDNKYLCDLGNLNPGEGRKVDITMTSDTDVLRDFRAELSTDTKLLRMETTRDKQKFGGIFEMSITLLLGLFFIFRSKQLKNSSLQE